jgi:hypothetical protein
MRGQSHATAIHPSDLGAPRALEIVRASMRSDLEKHRFWMVINALVFIISGLLTILPGPNLVAYYFAFRLVGHYLSMRGAHQALNRVEWTARPSPELTALAALVDVECAVRRPQVDTIGRELQLEHLGRFFDRVADPAA